MTNKFKVGDKVEFTENYLNYKIGDVVEVVAYDESDSMIAFESENGRKYAFVRRIKLVESKRTKKQRITALEATVAKQGEEINELKLIVAQIRKPSTVLQEEIDKADWQRGEVEGVIEFEGKQYKKVDREAQIGDIAIINQNNGKLPKWFTVGKVYRVVDWFGNIGVEADLHGKFLLYAEDYGRTPETVDVYELIVEDKQQPKKEPRIPEGLLKTANQLRAEIIEKAKGFIEDNLAKNHPGAYFATTGRYIKTCAVTFHVNTEKRTVVALVHSVVDKTSIRFKGITKCNPSDVFNEHIGKAIALGRALGLDVSEFEQAVQPDKFEVGQVISFHSLLGVLKNEKLTKVKGKELWMDTGWISSDRHEELEEADKPKIINDTNAIYSEVTK